MNLEAYHFIIIGGGTAGLVVAARLSEDRNVNVLVLEAGESHSNDLKVQVPGLMTQLLDDPTYDWCIKSTPQHALNGRIIAQPRGKLLGGSSAVNFMLAVYPSATDIDNWEKLGNPAWNWAELLPYYQKSETNNALSTGTPAVTGGVGYDPKLYGKEGPVQLTLSPDTSQAHVAWRLTMQKLGLVSNEDVRQGETLGAISPLKFIDLTGRRSYSETAYYAPNAGRKNLTLLTKAHVTKVALDVAGGTDGSARASSVLFTVDEKEYTASALNEIIISAGAINSPQILELSGIGRTEVLEKAGVELIIENPNVGQNLQDHPMCMFGYELVDGHPSAEDLRKPEVFEWALGEWKSGRGGPLVTGVSDTSFLPYQSLVETPTNMSELLDMADDASTKDANQVKIHREMIADSKQADVQIHFASTGCNPEVSEFASRSFDHSDPGNYCGFALLVNHPISRGSTHISSSDPKASPVVNPNYLASKVDFEMMVASVLFAQKVGETAPVAHLFKTHEDGKTNIVQPMFNITGRLDRAAAEALVRSSTITSWHPIGTGAMLPRNAGGVVDPRLRVYGVQNLRIVDASIMPLHVRGNICSSVYAIAERAADFIKQDWDMRC